MLCGDDDAFSKRRTDSHPVRETLARLVECQKSGLRVLHFRRVKKREDHRRGETPKRAFWLEASRAMTHAGPNRKVYEKRIGQTLLSDENIRMTRA